VLAREFSLLRSVRWDDAGKTTSGSVLGSASDFTPLPQAAPQLALRGAWWQAAVLAALLGWLYLPILSRLASQWWHDPDFSHGFLVPLFSLFVLWRRRSQLSALRQAPSWWGVPVLLLALAMLVVGVLGAELFFSRISLLVLIAGLVIFFLGWQQFRAVLFPLCFLVLMVPIPSILFNQITLPLQMLASKAAASILALLGIPVLREGNIIQLPAMALEVARACSGIRSLLTLLTIAIGYAFVRETRLWIRLALALSAVPIAIAANSLRIVGTGLMVEYWSPEKAEGFFHLVSSWVVFGMSLALLLLWHQLLRFTARGSAPCSHI